MHSSKWCKDKVATTNKYGSLEPLRDLQWEGEAVEIITQRRNSGVVVDY